MSIYQIVQLSVLRSHGFGKTGWKRKNKARLETDA